MRGKTLLALLLVALALSASQAQETGRRPGLRWLINRLDADQDGRLSASERGALRSRLESRRAPIGKSDPSSLTGLYCQSTSTAALEQVDLILRDPERGRDVPFRATYPSGRERCPVIVWSHGLFGSQDNYQPLVQHWARNGYLVLSPSHSDSVLRGEGQLTEGLSGNVGDWSERPGDVSALLDMLVAHPTLGARADLSRVGVGGHSFGAHTTSLLAGAKPRVGPSLADARPRAFLIVSPQGNSPLLGADSWRGITRPALFITGDNDNSPGGQNALWRLDSYRGSAAGGKSLLWITDAHHHFGGIAGVSRRGLVPNSDHVELVKAASLAFWDAHLKSAESAVGVLRSGDLGAGRSLYRWENR